MSTSTDRADGQHRRDAALDLLAARREWYVLRGRRALLTALLATGTATADDVRDAIELPADIDPVCLGSVPGALARAGIIRRAGYVTTCRPTAHARPVSVWELVDRAAAEQWLLDHPDRPDTGAPDEKAQRQLPLPLGDAPSPCEGRCHDST